MKHGKLKRFLLMPIGIIGVMQRRRLIRFVLLSIGIIGVLVISLVVLFSYTPNTSVPFPYIPPPEGVEGYYFEITPSDLAFCFLSHNLSQPRAEWLWKGENFIFKNVVIREWRLAKSDTYLRASDVRFFPQNPSDLKDIRVGDVIDIIGVCDGVPEGSLFVVIRNCQFLPAGLVPLPLPGGPAIIVGY